MNKNLYNDANSIINYAIEEVLPNKAVKEALKNFEKPSGKTIMISIGKAAYLMAKATIEEIEIDEGLVITKYGYAKEKLKNTTIIEAGHPLLDENSIKATDIAISLCSKLNEDDAVIVLISGGGSSLFESPLISLKELQDINNKLLKCGANINEINTIRKRLSKVKGGRFANIIKPAKVFNVILSDIIGDPLDMIASGPTYPDKSHKEDALNIVNKYHLELSDSVLDLLKQDIIKELNNIETYVTANNEELKKAAKTKAQDLGYKVVYINEALTSNIEDAKAFIIKQIENHLNDKDKTAIIMGGEITIEIKGKGLGGRNQELALRLAKYLQDKNACVFCVGSDGTDGPTDATGGYVDKDSYHPILDEYLKNNDSYHYLEKENIIIKTGPTLTNVCDLYVALIDNTKML